MRQTLTLFVPGPAIAVFAAALDPVAEALNVFEEDEATKAWSIRAVLYDDADPGAVEAALALAAASTGVAPNANYTPLEEQNWLEVNRRLFPPFRLGRFLIHGSHYAPGPQEPGLKLKLDAATAFGSGEHATTKGCLAALERLAKQRRVSSLLDMGCGSGILAIAASRLWPDAKISGIDIDAESVRVARYNARGNRVPVRFSVGNGYGAAVLTHLPRFEVIVANILAGPLQEMALDLGERLQPGGVAILSGLLRTQERAVLAAHQAHGLKVAARFPIDEWQTLMLEARHGK